MGLPGFTHVSTAQMSVPQEIISSAQRKRSAKGAIARPSGAAMKPPARRRMTTTVTQAVRNAPKSTRGRSPPWRRDFRERPDEPVGRAASEFNERVTRRERPVVKPGAQNEERPENGGDDAENELKKRCQHEFPTPEEKG